MLKTLVTAGEVVVRDGVAIGVLGLNLVVMFVLVTEPLRVVETVVETCGVLEITFEVEPEMVHVDVFVSEETALSG